MYISEVVVEGRVLEGVPQNVVEFILNEHSHYGAGIMMHGNINSAATTQL